MEMQLNHDLMLSRTSPNHKWTTLYGRSWYRPAHCRVRRSKAAQNFAAMGSLLRRVASLLQMAASPVWTAASLVWTVDSPVQCGCRPP